MTSCAWRETLEDISNEECCGELSVRRESYQKRDYWTSVAPLNIILRLTSWTLSFTRSSSINSTSHGYTRGGADYRAGSRLIVSFAISLFLSSSILLRNWRGRGKAIGFCSLLRLLWYGYSYCHPNGSLKEQPVSNVFCIQILTGILRHYATVLMNSPPKPPATLAESRERLALQRGVNLRANACAVLSKEAFEMRKNYLVSAFRDGAFLKDPSRRGEPPANPMSDPAGMEAMMGMLKGNMLTMISQTLIMSWINAFFAGFVICMSPLSSFIRFLYGLKQPYSCGVDSKQWNFLSL